MHKFSNAELNGSDDEVLALRTLMDLESENNNSVGPILEDKSYLLQQELSVEKYKCLESDALNKKDSPVFTEHGFGFRIVNPLISNLLLTERMSGRKVVSFTDLSKNELLSNTSMDWVIAGVILTKEVRNSLKTSKPFSKWRLSDLQQNMKTLTLLLFQNAHEELCRTPLGSCVAILNPLIQKNIIGGEAMLSINSANKVILLGSSKDVGICKAKKKNGEPCKNFVNINECNFCSFHVRAEYNKITRNVQKRNCLGMFKKTIDNPSSPSTYNVSRIVQKDKAIVNSLKTSTKNISKAFGVGAVSNINLGTIVRTLPSKLSTVGAATESSVYVCEHNSSKKIRAVEILKKRPIEKVDPNSIRGTKEGKKRALDKLITENPKRQKGIVSMDIQEIVQTDSAHKELINARQKEEENKYFNKLEKKEAMEEKMLSTFQLPCKAVICKICKYAAFSAADYCKKERHTIKIIDAIKRFFQCKDCGNRTSTLFKFPKLSCANCKSSKWERSGMIRDRTKWNTKSELSVRGDEEKFLGSASTISTNLLVPSE